MDLNTQTTWFECVFKVSANSLSLGHMTNWCRSHAGIREQQWEASLTDLDLDTDEWTVRFLFADHDVCVTFSLLWT